MSSFGPWLYMPKITPALFAWILYQPNKVEKCFLLHPPHYFFEYLTVP